MKKISNPAQILRRGFSMIELLVVVSIIVILAGIVIGAMVKVNQTTDKKQTLVTLQNTKLKLEEYRNDHNGLYPVGDDVSSAIVYNALSGDYSGRGEPPVGPVYWEDLNLKKNPSLVGTLNGKRVILDAYAQSLRYRSARDEEGNIVDDVRNDGDFDLWSIGPDGAPAGMNISSKLENEDTKDDIWPN